MGSRAAEVEITTAGGSKKQKEEGKGEKERERRATGVVTRRTQRGVG